MTPLLPTRPRVLLADVAGPARRALAALLADLDDIELVGEAGTPDEVGPAVRREHPDVLVIDDRLIRHADSSLPAGMRVIIVGVDDDPAFAARALALGADAWVVKDRADEDLRGLLASA